MSGSGIAVGSHVFTGIVEGCPAIREFTARGSGARIRVPAPHGEWTVRTGESVSVAGVCLTVASLCDPNTGADGDDGRRGDDMLFDLSAETLARTWFAELAAGRLVNLERSLRLGDRLSGHLVTGHVDGLGRIVAIDDRGDEGRVFGVEVDAGLERYLIEKGSIALDGVSLTVVEPIGRRFRVAMIPVTLELTSFGRARVGQRVNVEADLVGKWIEKLLPR